MEVYIYRGNKGEVVPKTVQKLIVEEGVQELPKELCSERRRFHQTSLPNGMLKIVEEVFGLCDKLLEITICSTVKQIGAAAFRKCKRLTKVDFDCSTSSPHHQLQAIGKEAFYLCDSLQRIKLPSSVTSVGFCAFENCGSLLEANLSTTGVTEISANAFAYCCSLQTVSLPNTVRRICNGSFCCQMLVTVVVPLDSQPIKIEADAFSACQQLANLVLPQGCVAKAESFCECDLLNENYGEDGSLIVAGLTSRFNEFPIHKLCYDHSTITAQDLRKCIMEQQEGRSLADEFGMTPFHTFFSTIEPTRELLDVLLELLPIEILKWRDSNGRRPLDYMFKNWTDGSKCLVQRTLEKSLTDRLAGWGATSWMNTIQITVQAILADNDWASRETLLNEAYSSLEHYENVEATSMLEMALWKGKLKSGWASDRTKRQALDRAECRCLSGSDIVIPHVVAFLGIKQRSD